MFFHASEAIGRLRGLSDVAVCARWCCAPDMHAQCTRRTLTYFSPMVLAQRGHTAGLTLRLATSKTLQWVLKLMGSSSLERLEKDLQVCVFAREPSGCPELLVSAYGDISALVAGCMCVGKGTRSLTALTAPKLCDAHSHVGKLFSASGTDPCFSYLHDRPPPSAG